MYDEELAQLEFTNGVQYYQQENLEAGVGPHIDGQMGAMMGARGVDQHEAVRNVISENEKPLLFKDGKPIRFILTITDRDKRGKDLEFGLATGEHGNKRWAANSDALQIKRYNGSLVAADMLAFGTFLGGSGSWSHAANRTRDCPAAEKAVRSVSIVLTMRAPTIQVGMDRLVTALQPLCKKMKNQGPSTYKPTPLNKIPLDRMSEDR